MNKSPLVSVNIRTLNSGKTLVKTFDSIRNQTYKNIEIIIADGGSKDKSVEIAKSYGAKVHYADKIGDARYSNYKKSNGKYVVSLDSDQILSPGLIKECVGTCERYNVDALIISEKSEIQKNTFLERLIAYDKWIIDTNKDFDAVFGTACPRFFRKSILSNINWPKKLTMFDDAILYSEILKNDAKVKYISNESITHHEVTSLWVFIKKFYRYGKGYFRSLQAEPSTVMAHSFPRRSYFSKKAFKKPHYFLGLLFLYSVKVLAASSGALSYFVERLIGKK